MKVAESNLERAAEVEPQALDAADEKSLCRLIGERTGLDIADHQLQKLREVLLQASKRFGYANVGEYHLALRENPHFSAELEALVAGITVGETYFFRHEQQIALLKDTLLPEIVARKRQALDLSLRIWSAGCSTGEEIYSLAILLHEMLPDIRNWALHLLATDINTEALSAAVRGRYRSHSFRATPEPLMKKYFGKIGDKQQIDETLRRGVSITHLNLAEDAFPALLTETYAMDLILCRNVVIYLIPEVARRITSGLAHSLAPDGVLLMGASDSFGYPVEGLSEVQSGTAR